MTMKSVLLFCCLIPACLEAQERSIILIPDSLIKGADVVNRDEEYVLTIKSAAKYTVYEKHSYTILNQAAARYAHYATSYDKFCDINSVSGKLYNAFGKEIKHTKKSDWKDYSAYDESDLFSDDRYKENGFYNSDYPFTVEYEEEDDYNGTKGFPQWMPQRSPSMSVQHSKFTIIAPADYLVRYRAFNYTSAPVITQKGDSRIYTWEVKNLPAKKLEVSTPSFAECTPTIFFAPSKFEIQGYAGDMSSWNNFGKFIYQLVKGRDELPDDIKRKVHELTDNLKDAREKINVLYDFLQKNTRYISVQLGIGGWQPFEAKYVAEKKYGDCKALSNYMIALLREAGITGKYILIYGGASQPNFLEDFSCSQFNHVICCVPLKNDTVWLECTSQTKSPGYMGSFTGNREALLIDETGGHLVRTPAYLAAENVRVRRVTGEADDQGNLHAEITTTTCGIRQELPHTLLYDESAKDRENYLNQVFNIPMYEVTRNDYKEHRGSLPSMDEYLQIQLNNYAIITGKRLFICPHIFGGDAEKLPEDTARENDYIINDAYRDIDSVSIKIPRGYQPENVPKPVSLQTKFGKYVSSIKVSENAITYYRFMEQSCGRYSPADYSSLYKFFEQVNRSDRAKVVLVKSE
jgi:Domain of Unknown Function with PDB structure (DUF3857)/Transglutaminase-like superfamily